MTKPLLTVIVVLLALALGLVAGVVIGRESVLVPDSGEIEGVERASNSAPLVTVEAEEGPADSETQSLLPEARPAPQPLPAAAPASKIEGLAFDGAAHLARLPWELDELVKRAEGGDAEALADVADWLMFCDEAERIEALGPTNRFASRGDLALVDVRAWFIGAAQECRAWRQRHVLLRSAHGAAGEARLAIRERRNRGETASIELAQGSTDSGQLQRRAAAAGHVGARAALRDPVISGECDWKSPELAQMNPGDRNNILRRCIGEGRLLIAERLLSTRDPRAIEAAPEILGIQPGVFFPVDLEERKVLWTLAACAFGLDCGPTGPALRLACARGVCGFGSFRAYAGDELLSPAAMRRVDRLVSELVRLIQAGEWAAILRP